MTEKLRDQRGAVAVEFALVVLILTALLLAILDFGVVLDAYIVAQNAAREGARYGLHCAALLRAAPADEHCKKLVKGKPQDATPQEAAEAQAETYFDDHGPGGPAVSRGEAVASQGGIRQPFSVSLPVTIALSPHIAQITGRSAITVTGRATLPE